VPGPHQVYGFLTTSPNAVVEPIHPKAMPVILSATCGCAHRGMKRRRCNDRCRMTRSGSSCAVPIESIARWQHDHDGPRRYPPPMIVRRPSGFMPPSKAVAFLAVLAGAMWRISNAGAVIFVALVVIAVAVILA
jgi:hypothetical protein